MVSPLGGSGNITVGPFAQANSLIVESSNADTTPAELTLYKNSASPANGDTVGQIEFRGKDSVASDYTYARIRATSDIVTNGSERGLLKFQLFEANAGTDVLTIQKTKINSFINFEFSNGSGVDFSAVDGSGATSSLFDDYEEGTWTPTFSGTSGGAFTTQPTIVDAVYTKIGRQVTVTFECVGPVNQGTASGRLRLNGLPYVNGAQESVGPVSARVWTGERPSRCRVEASSSYIIFLYKASSAGDDSESQETDLSTSGSSTNRTYLTLSYFTG